MWFNLAHFLHFFACLLQILVKLPWFSSNHFGLTVITAINLLTQLTQLGNHYIRTHQILYHNNNNILSSNLLTSILFRSKTIGLLV